MGLNGTVDRLVTTTPPSPPAPVDGTGGGGGGGGCFIATAAFGSPLAEEVQTLRAFRDRYLLTNAPGRLFVAIYYRLSPPLARWIASHDAARVAARSPLRPVVWWAQASLDFPFLGLFAGPGSLAAVLLVVCATARRGRRSRTN